MKKNGLITFSLPIFYFFLSFSFIITSCSVEENENIMLDIEEEVLSNYDKIIETHYLDGEKVTANEINLDNENWFTVLSGEELEHNTAHVIYRSFTSREKYEAFGIENNAPLKEMLAFEDEIHQYVEDNDLISYYNMNKELPNSYYSYEAEIYQKYFPTVESRALVVLFDNCGSGGGSNSTIIMPGTLPVMWIGWNNRVSQLEEVGIGSLISLYNRSFYFNRMLTFWGWGLTKFCLNGSGANNRMSSGLAAGL